MLSIKYHPFFEHPVLRTLAAFSALMSLFSILMAFNHITTYSGWPPKEFFVFPLALIAFALHWKQVTIQTDKSIEIRSVLAGYPLSSVKASEFNVVEEKKSFRIVTGEKQLPTSIVFGQKSTVASTLKQLS